MKVLLDILAWIFLVGILILWVVFLPLGIISGEFVKDLDVTLPGLIIEIFIVLICIRWLYVRKKEKKAT